MRVLFDTSALTTSMAGISFYTKGLMNGLRSLPEKPEVFDSAYTPKFSRNSKLRVIDTLIRENIWYDTTLIYQAKALNVDLIHCPAFFFPKSGCRKLVVTIHDLYTMRQPAHFNRWHRYTINKQIINAIDQRVNIIVPTAFVKNELLEIFPASNPALVHVIHSGIPDRPSPVAGSAIQALVLKKHRLANAFLLSVSTIEPRKNFMALLDAFALIKEKTTQDLVLVGQVGWKSRGIGEKIDKLGLKNRVHFLGYISDEDLGVLYSTATAFIFPSLYEGFGFTPLEAMHMGCAVAASNVSCMPEVLGGAALYFSPVDIEDMADKMLLLCTDPGLARDYAARSRMQASLYNWRNAAAQTFSLYSEIVRS